MISNKKNTSTAANTRKNHVVHARCSSDYVPVTYLDFPHNLKLLKKTHLYLLEATFVVIHVINDRVNLARFELNLTDSPYVKIQIDLLVPPRVAQLASAVKMKFQEVSSSILLD
jgi:hypothetical protein